MKTEKAYRPFQNFAVMIPAIEAAVGKNWLPSLILSLAALLICTWMSMQDALTFLPLQSLRKIAAAIILAGYLGWTSQSWPGRGAAYAIPCVLLVLGAYAVWQGSAVRGASVLRYGVYFVLLLMTFAGLSRVQLRKLRPKAELPDMTLAAALLLPLVGRKNEKWSVALNGVPAVITALLTAGATTAYAYSKGLSIGNVANHLESLAASALTVGWFAVICYILDGVKDKEQRDGSVWLVAAVAYGIYLTEIELRPQLIAAVEFVLWAVVPSIWNLKIKIVKKGKRA